MRVDFGLIPCFFGCSRTDEYSSIVCASHGETFSPASSHSDCTCAHGVQSVGLGLGGGAGSASRTAPPACPLAATSWPPKHKNHWCDHKSCVEKTLAWEPMSAKASAP